jgi:branched-chain amino acid transport system substrate-binding protein
MLAFERRTMVRQAIDRRSFVRLAGAGTAAALGFPAYLPRMGEAADTLKIGLVEELTGVYAGPSENEVGGFQVALDAWNKRGGVMGRQVQLVTEDSQNDPGVAAQKARKLIDQDKVVALCGTVNSAVSLSVGGVSNAAGMIFIDSGGHSDAVTGSSCHWNVFRTCHSTWMETHATGYSLAKRFGKRWFLITPDYAFGHALETGYRDVLAKSAARWSATNSPRSGRPISAPISPRSTPPNPISSWCSSRVTTTSTASSR